MQITKIFVKKQDFTIYKPTLLIIAGLADGRCAGFNLLIFLTLQSYIF